jgi:hypothetical protein
MDCMRQPVRIDSNMPFNAGYFLAPVVAFFASRIRVLDALGVNDAKARARRTTMVDTDLAN